MKHLPGVLSIIARVAGRKAALSIAAKHGGTELRIPLNPPFNHWLCQEIGWKAAREVAEKIVQERGAVAPVPFVPVDLPGDTRFDSSALNTISTTIGPAATMTLAEHFRGTRLYIPVVAKEAPQIVDSIGLELAEKLSYIFGRMIIYIAIGECLKYRVTQLCEAGIVKREIAERLKITERRVYRILGDAREDLEQ